MGLFSSITPVHYEIVRSSPANPSVFNHVFTSEIVPNTSDPSFKKQVLSLSKLANADENLPFRVKVKAGIRDLGYIETCVAKL